MISAPLKLLSAITSPIAQSVGRVVTGFAKTAFKGIDLLLVKPIKTLVLKPLAAVTKGIGKIIAAPFKLLGKVANKLNDKLTGFVSHLGNFTKRVGEELKSFIKNSSVGRWMERRKEDMKELTQHVKDAAVEFVSPLTDMVKLTIKSIGQHIKDGISKGFHSVTGWIGKQISGLFGKKNKDGKTKKESTLARIWRETAPGKRTDTDAEIDPNASQSDKRKSLWETAKEEYGLNFITDAAVKTVEGLMATETISVMDYVSVETEGFSGAGYAQVVFDEARLAADLQAVCEEKQLLGVRCVPHRIGYFGAAVFYYQPIT
jgi:hypothetical protein